MNCLAIPTIFSKNNFANCAVTMKVACPLLVESILILFSLTMGRVSLGHFERAFLLSEVHEAERAVFSSNGHKVRLVRVPV